MKSFKNLLIAAGLVIAIGSASSCKKLIKIDETIDGGYATFTIDPMQAGTINLVHEKTNDVQKDIDKLNLPIADIAKFNVIIESVEIIDDLTPKVNFDYLDKLSIDAESASMPKKAVCKKDPIPHTGLSIITPDMEPDTDWVKMIKDPTVKFYLNGVLNKNIDHKIDVKVKIKYNLKN